MRPQCESGRPLPQPAARQHAASRHSGAGRGEGRDIHLRLEQVHRASLPSRSSCSATAEQRAQQSGCATPCEPISTLCEWGDGAPRPRRRCEPTVHLRDGWSRATPGDDEDGRGRALRKQYRQQLLDGAREAVVEGERGTTANAAPAVAARRKVAEAQVLAPPPLQQADVLPDCLRPVRTSPRSARPMARLHAVEAQRERRERRSGTPRPGRARLPGRARVSCVSTPAGQGRSCRAAGARRPLRAPARLFQAGNQRRLAARSR